MSMPILVTGGTGTLGGHVVPLLLQAGMDLRLVSRSKKDGRAGVEHVTCDLLDGTGLTAALEGVETVLHMAGSAKGDEVVAANVVAAAKKAGVKHIVYVSVIGADKVPVGWVRSKLAAEQAIVESGVPYTILRAAQFHSLVLTVAQKMTKMPLVPAPGGLRFQPVDAREVAARLVELTLGAPAGLVPDISGPKVYSLSELNRSYLKATGKHRPMLPVRIPGKAGKAYRAGDNLALSGATVGARTWESFLAEQFG